MGQVVQMAGAVVVLGAFVANQWFRLRTDTVLYLLLNAFGTAVLAVVAGVNGDLGFLLLEGVWAVVSTVGLARCWARRHQPMASVTTD
jgi:hypothetical protein